MTEEGSAIRTVAMPTGRRHVIDALARLSDAGYQRRVWIERNDPHAGVVDDLAACIRTLYDESQVLPEPGALVPGVLLDGEELVRLRELNEVLDPLLKELGDRPDSDYLSDPRWPEVNRRAGLAVFAMIRAWGFPVATSVPSPTVDP
jgi:hypothetical protein